MKKLRCIAVGTLMFVFGGCYLAAAAVEGVVSVLIHGGLVACAAILFARDARDYFVTK